MRFSKKYNVLHKNNYNYKKFDLIPIRYSDRNKIMKWRNEQIYHLRQSKVLSYKDQNLYFNEIVYKLFYKDNPKQILFFPIREQYFGCLWWISSYKLGKNS